MNGYNATVFNAQTTGSVSNFINSYNLVNMSAVGKVTGSVLGEVKFQASNDFDTAGDLAQFQPSNWADISATVSSISGTMASSAFMINKFDVSHHYLRVVYAVSTGIGTMTLSIKGNGW